MGAADSQARKILRILKKEYPNPKITLNYSSQAQMLVAVILSAQCTDERVNLVTKKLFRNYRTFSDFANARQPVLERWVRPTGYYRQKAFHIREAARQIVEKHKSRLPKTMEELTALPGVGRKTANVLLSNAYKRNEGVVVDTHVFRVSRRLGISSAKTPEKVEMELVGKFPRKDWLFLSNSLIAHGRKVCDARTPRCEGCAFSGVCASFGKFRKKTNQTDTQSG